MHQDQGVLNLLTVVYELHGAVLRVLTTSSAEPMVRSMSKERPLLVSELHWLNSFETAWQISCNDRSLAPNPLGPGCLCSTTSHELARIAEDSHLGRLNKYPISFAASRVL
jgi:hypothetical protein